MDPHASWMLVRGLKTLAVRVARQNENAQRVAEFLAEHAKVRSVHYPFLKSHPQYAIAREQMSGGGGMVSFEVEGTGEDARRVSEPCACSRWRRAWAESSRWCRFPC